MERFKAIKTYREFPRNIHVVVASELILAMAFGIYSFLQILYLNKIGIPANKIGLIFSVGSLLSMIGFFMGPFIHMIGRKNILLIGCLLSAIGVGLYIIFTNFFMLLIAQAFVNIGLCFIQVTELQLLYSYTTPDKECCAYSYKSSANFIASTLGGILAGNINRISIFNSIGYKQLFALAVVLILIALLIRLFLLPKQSMNVVKTNEIKKSVIEAITLLKKHKKIRDFSILLLIISIGGSAIWPYNNLILKNEFNLSNTSISIIGFIITTLNMTGIILMPSIIEKIGIKRFEIVALIMLSLCTLVLSLGLPTKIFVIALILRCIFACFVGSSLDSSMMSEIELQSRDVFAGVKLLVSGIGCAIGNIVGGFIIEKINYRGIYVYGLLILIIVITFFYIKVSKLFDDRCLIKDVEIRRCNCHFKHIYITKR